MFKFWASQITFIVSGWLMTLILQMESYLGGMYPLGFISAVSQYVGMAFLIIPMYLFYFIKSMNPEYKPFRNGIHFKKIFPIAITDILDTAFGVLGINLIGSGLYVVIFSFVTIFAALLRYFWLKVELLKIQKIAICLILVGSILTACSDVEELGKKELWHVILGTIFTILATGCDAIFYVIVEKITGQSNDGINPSEMEICIMVGLIDLFLTSIYIGGYYINGYWDKFVKDPIEKCSHNHVRSNQVFWMWIIMTPVMLLHYLSFYYSISTASSVAAGVNKAFQSITLFFLSHILFCDGDQKCETTTTCDLPIRCYDPKQCLNVYKIISATIVFIGIILYAYAKNIHKFIQKKPETNYLIS